MLTMWLLRSSECDHEINQNIKMLVDAIHYFRERSLFMRETKHVCGFSWPKTPHVACVFLLGVSMYLFLAQM